MLEIKSGETALHLWKKWIEESTKWRLHYDYSHEICS